MCRQDSNISRISTESQGAKDELTRPVRSLSMTNDEPEDTGVEEYIEDSSVPQLSAAPLNVESSNLVHRTTSNTS